MLAKALSLIGGVLFLPVCFGYSVAFYRHLASLRQIREPEISLLLGITAYLAFHVFLGAPSRAYVLGHEMTHATAAWLSGGQVKGFKAGAKKGSVTVNRLSGFIALAPYLIPVYAILWTVVYAGIGLFQDVRPWITWFFFGLGGSLAFHLVFTVEALKQKQSDLEVVGPLLSLGIIYLGNILFVIGILSLMVPEIRFFSFLSDGFARSAETYGLIFSQLFR